MESIEKYYLNIKNFLYYHRKKYIQICCNDILECAYVACHQGGL